MQAYVGVYVYISHIINAFSFLGHVGCIFMTKLSTITIAEYAIALLVEAPCCKPEGRGFDSQ
jgi:hypothetical protein